MAPILCLRSARSSRSWRLGHHTQLDDRSTHSTWPLSSGGQCRARCCTRIHRTRQHAHQPSATLVTDALARRLTEYQPPLQRARSPLGLTIIAQDQCCCARNATRAASAPLGPLCTTARTQRFSLSFRTSHAVPTAHGGFAARTALFSCSGFPPFSWPAAISFYLLRIASRATPARMHARSLAHTRTTDERTTRRAVRKRG